jgi:hypothetical protein
MVRCDLPAFSHASPPIDCGRERGPRARGVRRRRRPRRSDGERVPAETGKQQSRLYRNAGDGTFSDVNVGRLPLRKDPTRALPLGDFDADGDLDIVTGNEGAQDRMYVNEGLGAFFDGTAARMPAFARETRALGRPHARRDPLLRAGRRPGRRAAPDRVRDRRVRPLNRAPGAAPLSRPTAPCVQPT